MKKEAADNTNGIFDTWTDIQALNHTKTKRNCRAYIRNNILVELPR